MYILGLGLLWKHISFINKISPSDGMKFILYFSDGTKRDFLIFLYIRYLELIFIFIDCTGLCEYRRKYF